MSELSGLSKCAARGAGLSWGMADEVAQATVWLARHALPGPDMLARLLTFNDNLSMDQLSPQSLSGDWSGVAGRLCPLLTGAALSDNAQRLSKTDSIRICNVSDPLFLAPFAASAALQIQTSVCIEWAGVSVLTDGERLQITGSPEDVVVDFASQLRCSVQKLDKGDTACESRVVLDEECLSVLAAFAQRTYAPATESSRLLGAGADVSDND